MKIIKILSKNLEKGEERFTISLFSLQSKRTLVCSINRPESENDAEAEASALLKNYKKGGEKK